MNYIGAIHWGQLMLAQWTLAITRGTNVQIEFCKTLCLGSINTLYDLKKVHSLCLYKSALSL